MKQRLLSENLAVTSRYSRSLASVQRDRRTEGGWARVLLSAWEVAPGSAARLRGDGTHTSLLQAGQVPSPSRF